MPTLTLSTRTAKQIGRLEMQPPLQNVQDVQERVIVECDPGTHRRRVCVCVCVCVRRVHAFVYVHVLVVAAAAASIVVEQSRMEGLIDFQMVAPRVENHARDQVARLCVHETAGGYGARYDRFCSDVHPAREEGKKR